VVWLSPSCWRSGGAAATGRILATALLAFANLSA
jgi:hypothetical protein